MKLTEKTQLIFDAVKRRPRTVKELIEIIWWPHPQDGNPDTVKAHVWHLNQRLRSAGLKVRALGGGNGKEMKLEREYRLVKL